MFFYVLLFFFYSDSIVLLSKNWKMYIEIEIGRSLSGGDHEWKAWICFQMIKFPFY